MAPSGSSRGLDVPNPLIFSSDRKTASVPVRMPKRLVGDAEAFMYATIDAADAHLVDDRNWFAKVQAHTIYARDRAGHPLHLYLFPMADEVDHLDHDGLNCRRSNLRPLSGKKTRTLQNSNTRAHRDGLIVGADGRRLKGIRRNHGKFEARITVRGIRRRLGSFSTADEAGQAYDRAAEKYFGRGGFLPYLNFPKVVGEI